MNELVAAEPRLPVVYAETTLFSYLGSRGAGGAISRGHLEATHRWWRNERSKYRLIVSQIVLDECALGDPGAAKRRLSYLEGVEVVDVTAEARELADRLVLLGAVPRSHPLDAFHIAVATVQRAEYLLTWNCKHIANATLAKRITAVCSGYGSAPLMCTPDQLGAGDEDD